MEFYGANRLRHNAREILNRAAEVFNRTDGLLDRADGMLICAGGMLDGAVQLLDGTVALSRQAVRVCNCGPLTVQFGFAPPYGAQSRVRESLFWLRQAESRSLS